MENLLLIPITKYLITVDFQASSMVIKSRLILLIYIFFLIKYEIKFAFQKK